MLALALLSACRPDCPEGQSFTASGECADIPSGSESIDGAEDLPVCELLSPGTRLDVRGGCADDVCARDEYTEFVEALGEPYECDDWDEALSCSWLEGSLWATFDDEDFDEVPDEGAAADILHVEVPWDGADESGLGVGISGACWLDAFGYTEDVDYDEVEEGELRIDRVWWDTLSASIELDEQGNVESVGMFGVH
ncbi:MAG: hypothetical protein ACOZNI_24570 [Myxococcota bacterium]